MARPRAFDVDDFLDQAMAVFWAKGFSATSMADIYAASSLGPGSVYSVVKDKDDLFRRVFERYADAFRETMRSEASGFPAIEAWTNAQVKFLTEDPERKGCLMTNTIMERHAHSEETQCLARRRVAEIREYFAAQIAAGCADGTIADDIDVDTAADALLGAVTGVMTLARGGTDALTLRRIAASALDALRPAHAGVAKPSRKARPGLAKPAAVTLRR